MPDARLADAESRLGVRLPADSRDLLHYTDGFEDVAGQWECGWSIERLVAENLQAWGQRTLLGSLVTAGLHRRAVLTPPDDLPQDVLVAALAGRRGLTVASMAYCPVGVGRHQWEIVDAGGVGGGGVRSIGLSLRLCSPGTDRNAVYRFGAGIYEPDVVVGA